jgi:hypothetical protein
MMNSLRVLQGLCVPFYSKLTAVCLLLYISLASFPIPAFAQTALTGGIRGNVTDASGAVVRGATVTIENKSLSSKQQTVTDENGRFTILRLIPDNNYVVQISASGFRLLTRESVAVVSGETNVIDTLLEVAAVNENVEITAADTQLNQTAEISQIIDEEKLNELPLYNRGIQKAALLDPHVRNTSPLGGDTFNGTRLSFNGRIFRETHYELDGNNNTDFVFNNAPTQTISLSSVQEFKILTNQYAAEHGGTTAGFVILTTKSGSNNFHGEGFFIGRPSGIQARPPLADRRIPNQQLQYGVSVGGPIIKDKTFFYANYEGTRQDRGSFIDLPVPKVFVGNLRENLGLFKIDQHFSDNHTMGLRVNGSYYTNNNVNDRITFLAQSAQPIQPSAAVESIIQNTGIQVNDTYTKNNFINELRLSYINAVPSASRPLASQPVIIRNGISTEGNNTFSNTRTQNYELADILSLQIGRHSLKFGGDYTRQKIYETGFQEFGTYTFDALGNLTRFSQVLGVNDLRSGQSRLALFMQDDFRLTSQLTLNLGLRYDYQSIIKDKNNFGSRVGFAYDIKGNGETVIRGGAGIYFDQPFYHGFTQRYLQGGPTSQTRTITLTPAQIAASGLTFPNSFDPRDPMAVPFATRNLFLRGEDIRSPYGIQLSLGIQQILFNDYIFNADVIHNSSRKQLLVFNQNAPSPFMRSAFGQVRSVAAADATRPFTTFLGVPVKDVLVSTNAGNAEYNALSVGLSKRYGNRYSFAANYVFSSAIDSVTDDHLGANVNEWSDVVAAERAQSDFNQRHRFVAYGTLNLPFSFEFTGVATLASGLRINPITGVDNNGDGLTVDRPLGFARNSFKGPKHKRFDVSLARKLMLRRLGENRWLELRADVFNAFNNANFYRFNNVYGNSATPGANFGRPLSGISSVDPGRQLQAGVRFVF